MRQDGGSGTDGARQLRVAGHFGEFLQGRLGADGPVALVTLPCPALAVTGQWAPASGFHLHLPGIQPPARPALRRFLARLGLPARGRFALRAGMEPGGGAGFSTASLVALAGLAGFRGPAMDLARAAIACEGASDPLMLPAPERLLWASRIGRVLGQSAPLPSFQIVGGFYGPTRRTDPADNAFPDIADLWDGWQAAARAGDAAGLARLAAVSAQRTLAARGLTGDPTPALARDLGALGCVIAHTGAARGLLFAPGTAPPDAAATLRAAGFRAVLSFRSPAPSSAPLRPGALGGF